MISVNPYNYNLPVGPEMFYGRWQDAETLAYHLKTMPGDSIALIGGRRIGKTSLLEAILRLLSATAEKGATNILPLPIFLDFTGENIDSVTTFFHIICKEINFRLGNILNATSGDFLEKTAEYPPAPAFGRLVIDWEQTVTAESNRHLRLILLLDECEQLTDQPWTANLYGALRYLLVGQETRAILKVVMTGSHAFLSQVRQRGSPLRNVLKYHRLQGLDISATYDLITQPTKSILSSIMVEAIAQKSGGHPFLTQYLMHHLWEYGLNQASVETVRQISNAFSYERSDFTDWLNGVGDAGLQVYKALMQAKQGVTESQIRAMLPYAVVDIPQALDALCYHGLVRQDTNGEKYSIAGEMFRDWFAANIERQSEQSGGTRPHISPFPPTLKDVMRRLDEMQQTLGNKLDDLKRGQRAIYLRLNPTDRMTVATILTEVRQQRIEQRAMHNTLEAIRRVLQHIQTNGLPVADDEIKQALADIYQEITSNLGFSQQFELSLPVIPLLLNYKVALGAGVDLRATWNELVELISY